MCSPAMILTYGLGIILLLTLVKEAELCDDCSRELLIANKCAQNKLKFGPESSESAELCPMKSEKDEVLFEIHSSSEEDHYIQLETSSEEDNNTDSLIITGGQPSTKKVHMLPILMKKGMLEKKLNFNSQDQSFRTGNADIKKQLSWEWAIEKKYQNEKATKNLKRYQVQFAPKDVEDNDDDDNFSNVAEEPTGSGWVNKKRIKYSHIIEHNANYQSENNSEEIEDKKRKNFRKEGMKTKALKKRIIKNNKESNMDSHENSESNQVNVDNDAAVLDGDKKDNNKRIEPIKKTNKNDQVKHSHEDTDHDHSHENSESSQVNVDNDAAVLEGDKKDNNKRIEPIEKTNKNDQVKHSHEDTDHDHSHENSESSQDNVDNDAAVLEGDKNDNNKKIEPIEKTNKNDQVKHSHEDHDNSHEDDESTQDNVDDDEAVPGREKKDNNNRIKPTETTDKNDQVNLLAGSKERKDLCEPSPCGLNSKCDLGVDDQGKYMAICNCIPGFYKHGHSDCFPGDCADDEHCPDHKACVHFKCIDPCIGKCGLNSHCESHNHTAVCSCMPGFQGNPVTGCTKQVRCSTITKCSGRLAIRLFKRLKTG